ncbi:MAG TPA: hypothetical protein VNO31_10785 [Umezawaea sp.]|nr:hypothetical protein [Umezawaea sp.]
MSTTVVTPGTCGTPPPCPPVAEAGPAGSADATACAVPPRAAPRSSPRRDTAARSSGLVMVRSPRFDG